MKKIFNVGLIGCGHIAETYFRAHKYFNNFKIIKCADINNNAAIKCAKANRIKAVSIKEHDKKFVGLFAIKSDRNIDEIWDLIKNNFEIIILCHDKSGYLLKNTVLEKIFNFVFTIAQLETYFTSIRFSYPIFLH